MCKISLSYLLKQKHYAQKGRQPYPNPNPNTNVFVISVIQYVPQATTAFFGQNRVKPTHIYYLDSNGPTYNPNHKRPQPLIHKKCSHPNYNPNVFVFSL